MKYKIIDNSGGLEAQFIRKLKDNVIVVSIIKALSNGKVKKGEVVKAVILTTKIGIRRSDGTQLKFSENSIALLTSELNPIGTRIFGPVPLEILHHFKIANLVSHFV
jgi:large subunit ribosomal protein L14